jgi:hypothetical protein
MAKNFLFTAVTADMNDDELKEIIHRIYPRVCKEQQGCLVTISGYCNDPRELWEIPEAIDFCQRLIDVGFISILAPIAQIALPGTSAFGAIEVWFVANGRIKNRRNEITEEDLERLQVLLAESNAKCDIILAQPCPDTGIAQMELDLSPNRTLSEGQHRHGS